MNRFIPALAAACFALASATSFAQAPGGDAGKGQMGRHMTPCSQEPDPAKCEANRKQMRDQYKAAHEACKDSKDKRGCMVENYCGKQANPGECKAKAAEHKQKMGQRMDQRQAAAEACTGKRGDALQQCYHDQHMKSGGKPQDKK